MANRYYSGAYFSRTSRTYDERNLHNNLGILKRVCLSLLLVLVHMVYKTDAYAWISTYCAGCNCSSVCASKGYAYGATGSILDSYAGSGNNLFDARNLTSGNTIYRTYCFCVTSAELSSAKTCYGQTCASKYNTGTGGMLLWDLKTNSCQGSLLCKCAAKYYRSNSSCIICTAGYYCSTTTSFGATNTGTAGRTACAAGYYASGTGNSTCKTCAAGYYSSGTANTTCATCAAGYYCPSGTSRVCPLGRYCPSSGMSTATCCSTGYYCPSTGLKAGTRCPSLDGTYGTTSGSCKTIITNCYIPKDTGISDTVGSYLFSSNCWYAS